MKEGKSPCDSCNKKGCPGRDPSLDEQERLLLSRMCRIRHKVLVVSGKGGVGKSTVAVNIAVALQQAGRKVGLLDVDIHGPSIPYMLALEGKHLYGNENEVEPVEYHGIKVASIGFALRNPDEAVIWRGPLKMGAIRQLLAEVQWGELDYLVIDAPPGTGDEPLSVCQLIRDMDGAIIVTTPQRIAVVDVKKSVSFCRHLGLRVLGIVENMSGFVCPHCGRESDVFGTGGGDALADETGIPLLGKVPLEPTVRTEADRGMPAVMIEGSVAGKRLTEIARAVDELCEKNEA